jgi:hypothetical protein
MGLDYLLDRARNGCARWTNASVSAVEHVAYLPPCITATGFGYFPPFFARVPALSLSTTFPVIFFSWIFLVVHEWVADLVHLPAKKIL